MSRDGWGLDPSIPRNSFQSIVQPAGSGRRPRRSSSSPTLIPGREDGTAGDLSAEVVELAHLRVPETVGRPRELDGDVGRRLGLVAAPADVRKPVGVDPPQLAVRVVSDDPPHEVPRDDPLVVPSGPALGVREGRISGELSLAEDHVEELVVQPDEDDPKLRDDDVLVVAGIADERDADGGPRQVHLAADVRLEQ